MIKDFTTEERKVLIAVAKLIATQDNVLSEGELEQFRLISEEEGFEDYQELFNEVDKEVKDLQDLSKIVNKVTWKETQEHIIAIAIEMARADGFESPEEHDIVLYLGRVWNIEIQELKQLTGSIVAFKLSIFIKGIGSR